MTLCRVDVGGVLDWVGLPGSDLGYCGDCEEHGEDHEGTGYSDTRPAEACSP